jgi:hypothetical protein
MIREILHRIQDIITEEEKKPNFCRIRFVFVFSIYVFSFQVFSTIDSLRDDGCEVVLRSQSWEIC